VRRDDLSTRQSQLFSAFPLVECPGDPLSCSRYPHIALVESLGVPKAAHHAAIGIDPGLHACHGEPRSTVRPIRRLLDQGCDLDADILPVVAREVPEQFVSLREAW
jgi:hypothetical protein